MTNNNNSEQIKTTRQPFSCLTNNNFVEKNILEKSFEHPNEQINVENIRKCPSQTSQHSSTTKEFRTELERLKYLA